MQPTQDPYGFIMNSPAKAPRQPLSMQGRILVVVGGVALLIIIATVTMSLLTGSSKAQTQRYIEIAQKQTEIVRISALAQTKARSTATLNFAVTTKLSVASSQKATSSVLEKRGIKSKDLSKKLAGGKNTKTDDTLKDAETNNRFDETFLKLLESELDSYKKLVSAAAEGATKSERKSLEAQFSQVETLRKVPQTPSGETIKPETPASSTEKSIIDEPVSN